MENNDYGWIWGIVVVVVIIIGGQQGWFHSETQIISTETITQLEKETQPIGETCSLSADKTNVNVGDIIVGSIKDGPQEECNVYYRLDGGQWTWHQKVTTNIEGVFTGNQLMPGEGNYEFKAICGDCITTSLMITVNPKEEKPTTYVCCNPGEEDAICRPGKCLPGQTKSDMTFTNLNDCNSKCQPYVEEQITPKCYENDGGANPSAYSTCYDTTMGKMVEFLMKRDTCQGDKGPLEEWYCDSGFCKSRLMECPIGYVCTGGYCHHLLCSDIVDPISQRDCDEGGCRGACSYIYDRRTDTDSCQCVSKCNLRYLELGYQYYYYYDGIYPPDSRECAAKANHECNLIGKENPLWLNEPYGLYGEQLEGRCCMWVCV